jgi:hypothetical protein
MKTFEGAGNEMVAWSLPGTGCVLPRRRVGEIRLVRSQSGSRTAIGLGAHVRRRS